ncbi:hypothetical protein P3X46_007183, partial [Hevea brasiliensis]
GVQILKIFLQYGIFRMSFRKNYQDCLWKERCSLKLRLCLVWSQSLSLLIGWHLLS